MPPRLTSTAPSTNGQSSVPKTLLENVLAHFEGARKVGKEYQALCPAHADSKPSLSIGEGDGGKIVLYCHAGCETEEVLKQAGLRMSDLFPPDGREGGKGRKAPAGKIVAEYDYRDGQGNLLYQAVRYEPKSFKQRRPDGKGGWMWNMQGVRRVLYRLPELLALRPGGTVFSVEGEGVADLAWDLGIPATTVVGGARSPWLDEYTAALKPHHVVHLPDNDDPGRAHVADKLSNTAGQVASSRVLELPGLPEKGDLRDWLEANGWTRDLFGDHSPGATAKKRRLREKLLALVAHLAKPWEGPPAGPAGGWSPAAGARDRVSGKKDPPPWGELVLVEPTEDGPPYPVDRLPGAVGPWVRGVATNSQTPPDLPAMIVKSALATALAKKAVIQPYPDNPDYTEPANVWTCTPMPSGNRKTFVVEEARAPFYDFLKEFREERRFAIAANQEAAEAQKKRKDALVDKLALEDPGSEKYEKVKAQLEDCLRKAAGIDTYVPRYFADDVTPERLAELMDQHKGRIAVLSDEGVVFDHFSGIYSKRPNLDVYLKGHCGSTLNRDRQGGGAEIEVERPALTLGISPQPQVIQGLSDKDRLQGRGLLARFLWSFPRSLMGERDCEPDPIPRKYKQQYAALIGRLLAWDPKAPVVVVPEPDAYELWLERTRGVEGQLGEGGPLGVVGIQEWAAKLSGAIARIALLFHCVLEKDPARPLAKDTMARALAVGEYLVPHARIAFKVLRTDPQAEGARVLQGWILRRVRQGEMRFTRSSAQQNHKARFPNVSDVDRPLRILMDRQVCRPAPVERTGPGQPPVWYEVNPALKAVGDT
jgi:hypothetical protein